MSGLLNMYRAEVTTFCTRAVPVQCVPVLMKNGVWQER